MARLAQPNFDGFPRRYMDPSAIRTFEDAPDVTEGSLLVRAVLLGSGEIRRVRTSGEVYERVLDRFWGLDFGDEGTYTGLLASELALDEEGLQRVTEVMDGAVKENYPHFSARFVSYIRLEDAVKRLDAETITPEINQSADAF